MKQNGELVWKKSLAVSHVGLRVDSLPCLPWHLSLALVGRHQKSTWDFSWPITVPHFLLLGQRSSWVVYLFLALLSVLCKNLPTPLDLKWKKKIKETWHSKGKKKREFFRSSTRTKWFFVHWDLQWSCLYICYRVTGWFGQDNWEATRLHVHEFI